MTYPVDPRLFKELADANPENVLCPPYCVAAKSPGTYRVTAWENDYVIDPLGQKIEQSGGVGSSHDYFFIFLINFILNNKSNQTGGEWISVNDLPGGPTFFRGPHEIPTTLISNVFGNDSAELHKQCSTLGGIPLEMADFSYQFDIIGPVKVALLYWLGDEDFPAEAKLLFDISLQSQALDVIYALLVEVCKRVSAQ